MLYISGGLVVLTGGAVEVALGDPSLNVIGFGGGGILKVFYGAVRPAQQGVCSGTNDVGRGVVKISYYLVASDYDNNDVTTGDDN